MGWAAIFQAIAQGITNLISTGSYISENKQQAEELAEQAQEKADARAKKAKYEMQEQKTSFLKSGVYFNTGTPSEIIKETYDTAMEDIDAINDDSVKAQKKLIRAGKTALLTFLVDPVGNNGSSYAQSIYDSFSNSGSSSGSSSGILTSGGISGDNITYA